MNTSSRVPGITRNSGWQAVRAEISANGFSNQVSLSGNGRYAAFASAASNLVDGNTKGYGDAFIRELGRTVRISVNGRSQANGASGPDYAPQVTVSDDDSHAAFVSEPAT